MQTLLVLLAAIVAFVLLRPMFYFLPLMMGRRRAKEFCDREGI